MNKFISEQKVFLLYRKVGAVAAHTEEAEVADEMRKALFQH